MTFFILFDKQMYICSCCEYSSNVKLGKCPSCGEFGSFVQDMDKMKSHKGSKKSQSQGVVLSANIGIDKIYNVYNFENAEIKRVFGEGLYSGGVYLIGGEPGIGKSTIMMQIAQELSTNSKAKIAYFSAEEQAQAIQKRGTRLGNDTNQNANEIDVFYSPKLEDIVETGISSDYNIIIIDSIQTIYSSEGDGIAGSIQQVRLCSEKIVEMAKKHNITILVIGHITKGGEIAGPKYLEHIVDVVIYIEGQRFGNTRFMRAQKNRFGPTDEVGIFEMTNNGLIPIYDFDLSIISKSETNRPGCVLVVGMNGSRPIIGNIETLINRSYGKFPSRNVVGIDPKRLDMILAILDKYCNTKFATLDVYVNIPGEVVFKDSGIDLGIAVALFSQYQNKVFDPKGVYIGEIGLSGKTLQSSFHSKRLSLVSKNFNVYDHQNINSIEKILKI